MQDNHVFGHCHACGETVSWYKAIEIKVGKERVIEELARLAGVSPLTSAEKTPAVDWWTEAKKAILKTLAVLNYLEDRGYTGEQIAKMDIGTFLKGTRVPSGIRLPPESHPLLLPVYESGSLVGCVGRAIDDREPKYMYPKGLSVSQFLLGVKRLDPKKPIVITEGLLDAILLNSYNIQAAAVGKAFISQKQAEILNKFSSVVLAMDNDTAGINGIMKAIPMLKPKTYILDLGKYKDPDELIRADGIDVFREKLDQAESSHTFYIRNITSNYNTLNDAEKDKILIQSIHYIQSLTSQLDQENCLKELATCTGLTKDSLEAEITRLREHKQTEKQQQEIIKRLQQMQEVVDKKEIHKLEPIITDIRSLTKRKIQPVAVDYDLLIQQNLNRPPGLTYPWRELAKLGEMLPGTITTLIGGTSHGKTSVANALALHFLADRKKIVYWSGEMPADFIAQRVTGYLAEVDMGTLKQEQVKYYQGDPVLAQVLYGRDCIKEYSKNLYIPEAKDFVEVEQLIAYCQQVDTDILIVDYIQQLRPSGDGRKYRTRDEEIEYVLQELNFWCSANQKQVIALGQMNRESKNVLPPEIVYARHSATIEHYSSVVLGIWNATMAGIVPDEETAEIPIEGWYWRDKATQRHKAVKYALENNTAMVEISILKNRHFGNVNKAVPLLFNGAAGNITNFPESSFAELARLGTFR